MLPLRLLVPLLLAIMSWAAEDQLSIYDILTSHDDLIPQRLPVGELEIQPRHEAGGTDSPFNLTPTAWLGAGYHSNIYLDSNHADSPFLEAGAGLHNSWWPSPNGRLTVRGEVWHTDYMQDDDRDVIGGLGEATLIHEGPTVTAGLDVGWSRRDEQVFATGAPALRDESWARGRVRWTGERDSLWLHSGVTLEDYLQDTVFFDHQERDSLSAVAAMGAEREFAADLRLGASLGWQERDYRASSRYNDYTQWDPRLVLRLDTGPSSWFQADAGVALRLSAYDFAHDPTYDDRRLLTPAGSFGWIWMIERLSSFRALASSAVTDSVFSNAWQDRNLRLDSTMRLAWESRAYISLAYHWLREMGGPTSEENLLEARFDLEHVLTRGVMVAWRNEGQIRYRDDGDEQGLVTSVKIGMAW